MAWSWNLTAMALARRHLGAVAAIIALTFAISGIAAAEPSYSFDIAPGKLPKTVIPVHYAIELTPDLESLALPGVEVIEIEVREPTARLTLNAINTHLLPPPSTTTRSAPTSRWMPQPKPRRLTFRNRSPRARTGCASASRRRSTSSAPDCSRSITRPTRA